MDSGQEQEMTKKTWWLVSSLMLWTGAFGGAAYSVPQFKRLFEEMLPGQPLPLATQLVCGVPVWLYAAAMAAGLVLLPWTHRAIPDASSCRKVNMLAGLLSILVFAFYAIGLFLPLTKLIERIGE